MVGELEKIQENEVWRQGDAGNWRRFEDDLQENWRRIEDDLQEN